MTVRLDATGHDGVYERTLAFDEATALAEGWTKTAPPLVGVSASPLTLSCTFNSIQVCVPFTGETPAESPLRFREAGETTWRAWLPLHPCVPQTGQAVLLGSLVGLRDGTTYEVCAEVRDAFGGSEHLHGTATTRTEDIPTHATLLTRVTHYVRLDGSDANSGTSPSSAWRTIARAHTAAPAGAVVLVGSGETDEYFAGRGFSNPIRTTPITFVAPYPATDDHGTPINHGRRTIVDGNLISEPSMPRWTPATFGDHTVWKWSGAFDFGASFGTLTPNGVWGPSRETCTQRIHNWWNAHPDGRLQTPEDWATVLHTNLTFRYGFWKDPASTDLYVRLPGDVDPNTVWLSFGFGGAFAANAPDCRLSGFVVRGWARGFSGGGTSHRLVIDHNLFESVTYPLFGYATTTVQPADIVVEANRVQDTGFCTYDPDTILACPWSFVKTHVLMPDGSTVGTKVGGKMEGMAVRFDGARRLVARRNVISGAFNGVSTDNLAASAPREAGAEWDVHDNLLRYITDDPVEIPRGGSWRVWNNRAERCLTWMSSGPTSWGPSYFWDNTAYECGSASGIARFADGSVDPAAASIVWKCGAASSPQTRFHVWHCTFYVTDPLSVFSSFTATGAGATPEILDLRDCIVRTGSDCLSVATACFAEGGNQFVTPDPTRGFRLTAASGSGAVRHLTVEAYRAASGQGEQTNAALDLRDTAGLDAQFVDVATGDLRLKADSVLVGKGARG